MFKRSLVIALLALFSITLLVTIAEPQNLCPSGVRSDKLVCLIPQVFGPNGLVLPTLNVNLFQNGALTSALKPLNSDLARQSALMPLASPSSGITFYWDPVTKTFVPSTDSFGPIFGERAETIGKYQVFLGSGYEYVQFDSIDGVNLKHLPVVLTQPDFTLNTSPPTTCSINTANNFGDCAFIRDVIKTENRIDFKMHQVTTFVSFGVTDRIDISAIIPIENVRMGVFSNATIANNSNSLAHTFQIVEGVCGSFSPPKPCLTNSFSNVRSVSGIGDITLRVKGTAWKGKRAALALGVDFRTPTGDGLNFLGAGALGVKPFVVWSYRTRFSPHAFVGYEVNGSSKSAGDISKGTREKLPSQLTYSAGADVWLTKRITAAFDLVGQQVFEAGRVSVTSFTELPACLGPLNSSCTPSNVAASGASDQSLIQSTQTFNITNASVGVKARPFSNLLITGNVLIKMNDGGFRATAVPFVGISYTF